MKRLILAILVIGVLLLGACAPAEVSEPPIPAHFTTYTSEGLFSISYPPDWVPATSVTEEVLEWTKEVMKTTDPEVQLETVSMLFLGGVPAVPADGSYYPSVNIIVSPRSVGYWTLDEIVEAESQYSREYSQRYREYSQVRTVVDGREAVIIDAEDYGHIDTTVMWRSLQLFMVKNKFVWVVASGAKSEHFKDYEDTFYSVVRSLRILD